MGMFKFVLLEMCDSNRSFTLNTRLDEILHLLKDANADFSFWKSIVLGGKSCLKMIAAVSAIAAEISLGSWLIRTENDIEAVNTMLPHAQPLVINIHFLGTHPGGVPTKFSEFIHTIAKHFRGDLELSLEKSYWTYSEIDGILQKLTETKYVYNSLTMNIKNFKKSILRFFKNYSLKLIL